MFDKLLKELKKLDGMKMSIPIESDENGFIDKECPDSECMFQFKVNEEDWANLFKDEAVFCPFCGNESESDKFWTTEQVENAEKQAHDFIEGKIHRAMKDDARAFNRRQPKGGFLTMSMSVKGYTPQKLILPIPSKEVFEQKITCEKCGSRYSVIGSAFFCPCCGHNSVEQTFDNTLKTIENSINNIPTIRTAISEISNDQAETTCRTLIEKGLLDCVVAFQRFCEVTYKKHSTPDYKIPFNAFQKLDVGGKLWNDLIGESYNNWLEDNEFSRLKILFQRRHLLQHTEGMVDKRYLERTQDTKYKVNQRITVKEKDVLELLNYVKRLTDTIKEKLQK